MSDRVKSIESNGSKCLSHSLCSNLVLETRNDLVSNEVLFWIEEVSLNAFGKLYRELEANWPQLRIESPSLMSKLVSRWTNQRSLRILKNHRGWKHCGKSRIDFASEDSRSFIKSSQSTYEDFIALIARFVKIESWFPINLAECTLDLRAIRKSFGAAFEQFSPLFALDRRACSTSTWNPFPESMFDKTTTHEWDDTFRSIE